MNSLLFLGLLLSCNTPPAFECDANTPCDFGSQCVQGQCEVGRCATSAQCPMESYCSNRECVTGCESNSDCLPGDQCDLTASSTSYQTCTPQACAETHVDCGYREFCNSATGECYDAGGQYCNFCNDDSECGEGNLCLAHYCGVDCSSGRDCPAGFECYPFGDDFGNVVAYQCFTYCWLYDGSQPGSLSVLPPKSVDAFGVPPIKVAP